jgi:hypothetical protein
MFSRNNCQNYPGKIVLLITILMSLASYPVDWAIIVQKDKSPSYPPIALAVSTNINHDSNFPFIYPNPVGPTGQVTITINYTDNTGVSMLRGEIKGPSLGSSDPKLLLPIIGSAHLSLISGSIHDGTWRGTFTFPNYLPDGSYIYSLISTDTLGNTRTIGPFSGIILDRHPASKHGSETIISSAVDGNDKNISNNGSTTSSNITFGFEGTTRTGVVLFLQCNLDDTIAAAAEHGREHGDSTLGSTYSTCLVAGRIAQAAAGNLTYTDLDVGRHIFKVRVVDNEYNIDDTPATFSWTVLPSSQ